MFGASLLTHQPFNVAPYFYDGDEIIDPIPDGAVDWVLVEIRKGTPNESGTIVGTDLIERVPCLLSKLGLLWGAGASVPIANNLLPGEEYYILIRHRNHLDVISAFPISVNSDQLEYSFELNGVGQNPAFGVDQQKEINLPNGNQSLYLMIAGDYNGDGTIQNTDFDKWKEIPAVLNTYSNTDGNLDGTIQNTDSDIWKINKAKAGITEIRLN